MDVLSGTYILPIVKMDIYQNTIKQCEDHMCDGCRENVISRTLLNSRVNLRMPYITPTPYPHEYNRAPKSLRTLQNKVRIKVFPEQLTLFINTFVALKQCIIQ